MKVVVILEDATHDPQIIKPVLTRLFDELSLRLTPTFCRELQTLQEQIADWKDTDEHKRP